MSAVEIALHRAQVIGRIGKARLRVIRSQFAEQIIDKMADLMVQYTNLELFSFEAAGSGWYGTRPVLRN